MSLLVSIHDVTPAFESEVRGLWAVCQRRGIVPALLVVPDWHGGWRLDRHPGFVGWLRTCAADGAEVLLHGERHDEVGSPRSIADGLRAWGRTDREGEFLTLGEREAGERIERGRRLLTTLGLPPAGFVPPAWLARAEGHRAAGAAGLAFSEDARFIFVHRCGRRLRSPVVRWSARSHTRAIGSTGVAAARWLLQRGATFPRIALHPADLRHPATAWSLEHALDRWLTVHRPSSYSSALAAA